MTLNLLPVVNNVLVALSDKFGGVLGLHLDLPPAPTNGQLPPGLRDRLAQALGVTLPPSFGQIASFGQASSHKCRTPFPC